MRLTPEPPSLTPSTCPTRAWRWLVALSLLLTASAVQAGPDLEPVMVGISNPFPPRGSVHSVAVKDGVAYCTVGSHLAIFDVHDPTKPLLLTVRSLGSADGYPRIGNFVALFGNHLCLGESSFLSTFEVSDPAEPRLLATVGPLRGGWNPLDLTISGRFAYVALGEEGIQVIDLADPAHPRELGWLDTVYASGVAVAGSYAYVADQAAGLQVIDVSDPTRLKRIGGYKTSGPASALALRGNHAFVAAGNAGIQVFDIGDPAVPKLVGGLKVGGDSATVKVSGNQVYGGDRHGFHVIDASDPTNLVLRGAYVTGGFETPKIALDGGYSYLAAGRLGLQVVDVRDPTSLRRAGGVQTDGIPWEMVVHGSHAIVAEGNSGLQIIDLSDSNNARRVGWHETEGEARALVVQGNLAYTLAQKFDPESVSLEIFDIGDVSNPRRLSAFKTSQPWMDRFAVAGGYAYLTSNPGAEGGLDIIDVGNPASPRAVGSLALAQPGLDVAVAGPNLYVSSDHGVDVFDLHDPANPKRRGHVDFAGAWRLVLAGDYLYVTGSGLRVMDVRDPANPRIVGEAAVGGGNIVIAGQRAYLLASRQSVQAVDISDPAAPRLVASASTTASSFAVAAAGERLFVIEALAPAGLPAFWTTGVEVFDFSRRANPQSLGRYPADGAERRTLAVTGNLACVTSSRNQGQKLFTTLEVVDVGDPTKPHLVGTNEVMGAIWDVAMDGKRAYLAVDHGLQILDLGNPVLPTKLGSAKTTGLVHKLALSGHHAYLAGDGLEIFDVSDPVNPRQVGHHGTVGKPFSIRASSIKISGNLAYMSTGLGLEIFDITKPENPVLLADAVGLASTAKLAVFGNYAAAAHEYLEETGAGGLVILDLSKPAQPRELSRVLMARDCPVFDVAVQGGYAYLAVGNANSALPGGVEVYDLSDPAKPRRVGGSSVASGYDLVVSGGKVYLAGVGGLAILNTFVPVRLGQPTWRQGALSFSIAGPIDWSLRVQRSSDLTNWRDWRTVAPGPTAIELDDLESASQARGFYRVVAP